MFSFFKRKPKPEAQPALPPQAEPAPQPAPVAPPAESAAPAAAPPFSRPLPPAPVAPAVPAPVAAPTPAPQSPPVPAAIPEPVAAVQEAAEEIEIVAAPEPAPEVKRSWLSRLKAGLSKTSSNLTTLFVGRASMKICTRNWNRPCWCPTPAWRPASGCWPS
jgi:fused signal recognition particle receptor